MIVVPLSRHVQFSINDLVALAVIWKLLKIGRGEAKCGCHDLSSCLMPIVKTNISRNPARSQAATRRHSLASDSHLRPGGHSSWKLHMRQWSAGLAGNLSGA